MIKITLDHSALKTLLEESGEEFAIELRGAVLKAAAKNAGILSSEELIISLNSYAKQVIQDEIGVFKQIGWGSKLEVKLQPDFVKEVEKHIDKMKRNMISNLIVNTLKVEEVTAQIEATAKRYRDEIMNEIDRKLANMIFNFVDEQVTRRIDDEVRKRIALITKKDGAE